MKLFTRFCASALTLGGVLYFCTSTYGQEVDKDLFDLSLKELMQIPIESASKKKETLFEAPLAGYTITASEIANAGVNNIPEALRLAPGMIVRQQTNGVYDVQIRGLENISRGSSVVNQTNTATLVMVDNRPVFNHNLGGTFWESIPVDISDIDRIEIVRGPAAPLFGPNAVTGVINIITVNPDDFDQYVSTHFEHGSNNSTILSARISKKLKDELSVFISGNAQQRERFTDEYINPFDGQFGSTNDLPVEIRATLNEGVSVERSAINAGVSYIPKESIELKLAAGYQDSDVLKNYVQNNQLSMGWAKANSGYLNLDAKLHNLNIRSSLWSGRENLSVNIAPGRYDFEIFETTAEYEIAINNIGRILPGLSYTRVEFSDEDYSNQEVVYLQGQRFIETRAVSLRSDWNLSDNWRLIAALRIDDFTTHSDKYLSYQLATTYKINSDHVLRASISRSNSGSFIGNNFLNSTDGILSGSTNMDLFQVRSIELGYRAQLSNKLQVDLDFFRQHATNPAIADIAGFGAFGQPFIEFGVSDAEAVQTGLTVSANFVPVDRIQIKPFITIQNTQTDNVPTSYVGDLDPNRRIINSDHEQTPAVVGGWFLNYSASSRLNINVSGYFHSSQTIYDYARAPEFQLEYDGKLMLNASVTYHVKPGMSVFGNARNLFADDTREFINTERVDSYFGTGIRLNLNK